MAATVKITSVRHPVLVEVYAADNRVVERIIRPEDGEITFHGTTLIEIRVREVEPETARLIETKKVE